MGNNLNFAGAFGCFRIDLEFYLGHFCAPAFRQQLADVRPADVQDGRSEIVSPRPPRRPTARRAMVGSDD